MKLYWVKTNRLIKQIFSEYIWHIKTNEQKTVYLTFDDGPIDNVTNWTLDLLKQYNAKATFFCIGDNIEKHPEVFKRIIHENHSVGNHTFNHLNGWKTSTQSYIENIIRCQESIKKFHNDSSLLFRPPYGKLKKSQSKIIREKGYKIIMWDILSADFDNKITKEKCLENVIKNIENGSIIIFHDSLKASKNLQYVLPKTLEYLKKEGYECLSI